VIGTTQERDVLLPVLGEIHSARGVMYGMRYEWTRSLVDLNRAIGATDKAVKATPSDHPNRAGYLYNLGNRLGTRFERTGAMDDLNHAVEATNEAVKATPSDHPDQARHLNSPWNLARKAI
jgi:Tetratricopeptide repeat